MSDKVSLGKYISYILRHHPEAIGITLDEHGWADVQELLAGMNAAGRKIDMELLEEIVATNNKKRYSFNEDKTKIRANQGHSINVDVELKRCTPPDFLWHGTGEKYVSSIDEQGLRPKSRLHVHLSSDYDTAVNVGSRHGKPVVYKVNSGAMERDGYEFYRSENGVWLTGEVPARYMEKV
ncbi:MAG: RNA 2'-phosphotransferase [Lachnospira sp.]|nr:RNA 2'-phosphotransferase [Lachnospira sp.]